MKMSFGRSVASLAVLGLVALGASGAGPAGAQGSFDGVYKGSRKVALDNNSGCRLVNHPESITIRNNHLRVRLGSSMVDTNVASDGSFSGSTWSPSRNGVTVVSLKGRIVGGKLEADIGVPSCVAHLSLSKV